MTSRRVKKDLASLRKHRANTRLADKWSLVKMSARITELETALSEIEQLAGRNGPPNELDALNEIEAIAKRVNRQPEG